MRKDSGNKVQMVHSIGLNGENKLVFLSFDFYYGVARIN